MKTVTTEMIEAGEASHGNVKEFDLRNGNDNLIATVLFGRPSAWSIKEFEKWLDKDSMKARAAIINGTVCDEEQKEMVKGWKKNSDEYLAAYDAALQMLPQGKATVKNA